MTVRAANLPQSRFSAALTLLPGIALAGAIAVFGYVAAPFVDRVAPIPAMVITLLVGIALNAVAARAPTRAGMNFCVRTVLRWAVALMGLRVGLSDIAALGLGTAALIVVGIAATIASGFVFASWGGRTPGFGALAGVGTGVCGASATLAVSTVVPDYDGKAADIAFVVVAINAIATLTMLIYPPVCVLLGFDPQSTGIMLGGTIHDVAQVAGAGYAVSTAVGNTAVIVKLFRVFLLLPVVLGVGYYFTRRGMTHGEARVPLPLFAFVFLLLCALNSAVLLVPSLSPAYQPIKHVLVEASNWGLLLAIASLGLSTSVQAIIGLGWRHIATVLGTTAVIFVVVTGGLLLMRAEAPRRQAGPSPTADALRPVIPGVRQSLEAKGQRDRAERRGSKRRTVEALMLAAEARAGVTAANVARPPRQSLITPGHEPEKRTRVFRHGHAPPQSYRA